MRKPALFAAGLALALSLAGCSDPATPAGTATQTSVAVPATTSGTTGGAPAASGSDTGQAVATSYSQALTLAYDDNDLDSSWDEKTASFITLADGTVRFDGKGAAVDGGTVTITQAGTYVVSGAASDGQIVVNVKEVGLVRLVLNGADLTCSDSAPVYVKNAEKVVLVLADGTQNSLTDGATYTSDDTSSDGTSSDGSPSDEPNAAVFSKADLTINGGGALKVTANYNDGITSKDTLKIVSGLLTIDAANDAVNGKDCLGVKDASLTIVAKDDGLQSTNDTAADKGFICISGGTFDITAGSDALQAVTTLLVTGGAFDLATGGGSANAKAHAQNDFGANMGGFPGGGGRDRGTGGSTTTTTATAGSSSGEEPLVETENESSSSKGLKAGGGVFVEGGTFVLDCADDTIHSNGSIDIKGGSFTMASGDDAIHADVAVTIAGGEFAVSTCYEGIESNAITIDDGTIALKSGDDAINGVSLDMAASGTASSGGATWGDAAGSTTTTARGGGGFGRGGGGFPGESGNARLAINGGSIAVDAGGDGIDINGNVEMNGGTVVVNGPSESFNGALDYLNEFKVTGGLLIAAGSSGMAEAPSDSSSLYSIMVNFDKAQAAGTIVRIEDESGKAVLTMAPSKQYQSVVLCSADLKEGATYTVYLGGSMTGTATNTVFGDGSYSGGTKYATLTLTSKVTMSGTAGMMGGGMGGGGRPGGGSQPSGGGTQPSGGGTPPSGANPPSGGGGTPPAGDTPPTGGPANGGGPPSS
jgi:hypothetical protein